MVKNLKHNSDILYSIELTSFNDTIISFHCLKLLTMQVANYVNNLIHKNIAILIQLLTFVGYCCSS